MMKEYGIRGNYQYDLYPFPAPNKHLNAYNSGFGEVYQDAMGEHETTSTGEGGIMITNSFGMSPELSGHLNAMGIMGNYQYDLYPFPAPNKGLLSSVSKFGKKKRKKRVRKKRKVR